MKIVLISDLHADTAAVEDGRSHVQVEPDANAPKHDALLCLHEVLPDAADLLFATGDLCNRADPIALRFIWKRLLEIGGNLGAQLYAVPGNHDMDSHFETYKDPKGLLLSLESPFPTDEDEVNDRFWARNFVLRPLEQFILIQLNSAALHGYQKEHEHGRVSAYTVQALRKALDRTRENDVHADKPCVLLCHHHPFPHPNLQDEDGGDQSSMYGAHLLQQLIDEDEAGWLIIHGHRHFPRVFYAPGDAHSAIVVSAGSIGADLTGIDAGVLNSAHVLNLEWDEAGHSFVGEVWTWTFAKGTGWSPSTGSMPYRTGFGERQAAVHFIQRVTEAVTASDNDLGGTELYTQQPRLRHLMPTDNDRLIAKLQDGDLQVETNLDNGLIERVLRQGPAPE